VEKIELVRAVDGCGASSCDTQSGEPKLRMTDLSVFGSFGGGDREFSC